MALDRWIALIILLICVAYGYTAFFTMDAGMPPFMRRSPIWPSTFPKSLAFLGIIISLSIVLGMEKSDVNIKEGDINYRNLGQYKTGQAFLLLLFMVAYALFLRPMGFLASTIAFLVFSGALLGERKFLRLFLISGVSTAIIWYLVQEVLGIFLRPFPFFLA
jgi:putative tricarboxylic transport membrane protein